MWTGASLLAFILVLIVIVTELDEVLHLQGCDALPSKPYGKVFWLRSEKAGHTPVTRGLHKEILEARQRKLIAAAEFGCLIK